MPWAALPPPFEHLCTPLVGAEPAYRGRVLKGIYSKPKSADSDSSAQQVSLVDLNDVTVKCSTPYRLPRITPPCDSPTTQDDIDTVDIRVFGRFGFEDVVRMPELGPSISKALINPHSSLAQRYRQAGLAVPRFKTAAITPSFKHPLHYSHHGYDDDNDEYGFKSVELTNPSATPVSRSISPAKSVKSIHWALGNERNPVFDSTGRGRIQGPFSREFTVRCMPPPNWMRMKWGRSRTMVH